MKQINDKLYINEDNVQGVQKLGDNYILTTTNGNNLMISESIYNDLKEYEGGGGGESSTLLTTTTDATLVSGTTYELALTYLTETPKVNDFIAYINSGAITTLYKVTAVDSTNATLEKIGDIGGGIPTITITSSQMISQNKIQLTQEQYDLLSTNGVVNVDLMGMQLLGMVSNNASNGTNIELMCSVYDNGIQGQDNASIIVYAISVVKSTMIATFYQNSFGKAKQLYQHHIYVQCYNTNNSKMLFQIMFNIINSSNEELTTRAEIENEIFNILGTNSTVARNMANGAIIATGFVEGMGQYNIFGIVTGLNATLTGQAQAYYVYSNASSSINYGNFPNDTQYPTNRYTIKDIVKPL